MKGGFQYGNMDKEISENVNTDTCHLSRYRLHGILKCTGSHQKVRYNLLPYLHKWQKRQNNNKLWQKILYVCKGNTLTMYASFNTSKNGVLNSKNKKAYVKYGKHKFKLTSKTKYYFSGGDGPNRYCSKSSFMSTMRSMNGLGLCIKVTNGKVVEMSFRS